MTSMNTANVTNLTKNYRTLVISCIIIAVIVLAAYYTLRLCRVFYMHKPMTAIAQVSLREFKPELVKIYRTPYILEERLPDTKDLQNIIFRFEVIKYREFNIEKGEQKFITHGMYTIIHSELDDQYIDMMTMHQNEGGDSIIEETQLTTRIKLNKGRVLILPPHLSMGKPSDFKGSIIHAYDITSFLATLFRK